MVLVIIMSFSEKLANAMREKQISTRQLSELTGIPKSAIQRYTSGETEKIPIDRMVRMAEAMGIDPAYVMGWVDDSSTKIAASLGTNSLASKKLREIGNQLAPSPLLRQIGEAFGASPQLRAMTRAMLRMSADEQQKMVDVGKALFPEQFSTNEESE